MMKLGRDAKIDLTHDRRLALRFYGDAQPHMLQTANLQKGAIVVCDGEELVEEGLGIGVPVCKYHDGTRFSLVANTFFDDSDAGPRIVKIYEMNGVASKRFRQLRIRRGTFLAHLLKILEKGYRGLSRWNTDTTIMLRILSIFGMRNEYAISSSKGRIMVSYHKNSTSLEVKVDFHELSHEGLQSIVLANEQGGMLFNEYQDSTGITLYSEQIEPWRTTQATWASLCSQISNVRFKLHRPNHWIIVRGREVVRNRISWSGLDLYCEDAPGTLEYSVEISGATIT
jgi:hypothetical protein